MAVTIVAGAQWGDEGKGKVVDLLAGGADYVVRCQGGPNAGHTVVNERGRFILHAVPSGIFSPRARCVVGAGTVVSPSGLVKELRELANAGVDIGALLISERAHLVLPYHPLLEALDEASRAASDRIAPTGQGIAPAYVDKVGRCGLRAGDLRDLKALNRKLREQITRKNQLLASCYHCPPIAESEVVEEVETAARFLAPYVGDTVAPLHDALNRGQQVILEGQLGVMRDLDWGAYPFVTSSSPIPAGMLAGAGLPPRSAERIIGVAKAYTTAVGAGPFPTELNDAQGEGLRDRGDEYGATTGRPRRCGWFDAVAASWAARVAGFTELVLTKLDVLDGLESISVCTAYQVGADEVSSMPLTSKLEEVRPVYTELRGWSDESRDARDLGMLPETARGYVAEIARLVGLPISLVSVGPAREQVMTGGAAR